MRTSRVSRASCLAGCGHVMRTAGLVSGRSRPPRCPKCLSSGGKCAPLVRVAHSRAQANAPRPGISSERLRRRAGGGAARRRRGCRGAYRFFQARCPPCAFLVQRRAVLGGWSAIAVVSMPMSRPTAKPQNVQNDTGCCVRRSRHDGASGSLTVMCPAAVVARAASSATVRAAWVPGLKQERDLQTVGPQGQACAHNASGRPCHPRGVAANGWRRRCGMCAARSTAAG